MNELLFLSCPCAPKPIRRRPTSWTSCSCRSCDKVWYLKASWRGVSPSLSATFKLAPSRTSSYNRIYESRLIIEPHRREINLSVQEHFHYIWTLAYFEMFDRILSLRSDFLCFSTAGRLDAWKYGISGASYAIDPQLDLKSTKFSLKILIENIHVCWVHFISCFYFAIFFNDLFNSRWSVNYSSTMSKQVQNESSCEMKITKL